MNTKLFKQLVCSVGLAFALNALELAPASANEVDFGRIRGGNNSSAVSIFDIGQGSCSLITCPNGDKVLVDCGTVEGGRTRREEVRRLLNEVIPSYNRRLRAIFLSHPHTDHYNAIKYVLSHNVTKPVVEEVIYGGELGNYDQEFVNWLKTLKTSRNGRTPLKGLTSPHHDHPRTPIVKCSGTSTSLAGVFILAGNVGTGNQASIVVKFQHGNFSAILAGDAGNKSEEAIHRQYARRYSDFLLTDVLNVGHHGSSRNTSGRQWIKDTQPQIVVFSAGDHRGFFHPRCIIADEFAFSQFNPRLLNLDDDVAEHPFECAFWVRAQWVFSVEHQRWEWRKAHYEWREEYIDYAMYNTFVSGTIFLFSNGRKTFLYYCHYLNERGLQNCSEEGNFDYTN